MKAFLLYRDSDADRERALPANAADLVSDLGLRRLFEVMAEGDRFLFDVAQREMLAGLWDVDQVRYRQEILRDCVERPNLARELYAAASTAISEEGRNFWGGFRTRQASSILRRSIEVVTMFLSQLERIRVTFRQSGAPLQAEGWSRFANMLEAELDDAYIARVRRDIERVAFSRGIPMNAQLGAGNRSADYALRDEEPTNDSWIDRLLQRGEPGYTFELHPRDESGARALSELGDRGVNLVANALAQAADHILAFFTTLRYEIGFYVGCLNMFEALTAKGLATCFPRPAPATEAIWQGNDLFDPVLALSSDEHLVTNHYAPVQKPIVVITGANRGGKSTLLRAVGCAQLMLQCGMFVPASSMRASLCAGLFTHYKREEDQSMEKGKLDEELHRMDELVQLLRSGALVLSNESFASTNEREGSEIAFQIVTALSKRHVRVVLVTHLYDLARRLSDEDGEETYFLRAERVTNGRRTFKLTEGAPLPTSYGLDLYDRVMAAQHVPAIETLRSVS